jgi:predicted nucleic acid-binding protein
MAATNRSRAVALDRGVAESCSVSFDVIDSTWVSFQSAFGLSVSHEFQMCDTLVMAVAAESRCRIMLSEDLQHGFTWLGVTVVCPFLPDQSPLLPAILSQDA